MFWYTYKKIRPYSFDYHLVYLPPIISFISFSITFMKIILNIWDYSSNISNGILVKPMGLLR